MTDLDQYKPRVGDPITYLGEVVGHVTRVDGALCWRSYPDGDSLPFIWKFRDGLNRLHDWPNKRNGPTAKCPGAE